MVSTTIDDARQALATHIKITGYPVAYDEQVLDLAVTRPAMDLKRYLGTTPTFTFRDLVAQAEQWQRWTPVHTRLIGPVYRPVALPRLALT